MPVGFGNTGSLMGQQLRKRVKRKARDRRNKRLKERVLHAKKASD